MTLKIYITVWVLGITSAGLFYLTGNLTPFYQVLFGLLTFGALFLGFLSIIPAVVFHGQQKH